ncbi:MAG: prolyl oligopeptidase family serine peptidase [Acidobacteria bacterium]|nr:prolyl oligopeptidase family serine peptidase [Acidobacteriota bacterium]
MNKTRILLTTALILATVTLGNAAAQDSASYVPPPVSDENFELSIRNIMRAEENVGVAPSQIRWTDDSEWVYFSWRPGGLAWDERRKTYRVRADGTGLEALTAQAADEAAPLIAGGDLSSDGTWRVSSVRGDLYLVDRGTMEVRRLTHTEDSEGQPLFTADDSGVIFRRGNNLFVLDLDSGDLSQLTRVEDGAAPAEDAETEGHKAFLEAQQEELFEHIRRDRKREHLREIDQEAREAGEPASLHLARGERLQGMQPTRSGEYVLVRAGRRASDAEQTIVPDWVTSDGYTRDLNTRSKVGDEQGTSRLGLVNTATGDVTWVDVQPEDYESEEPARVFNSGWNDAGTTAYVFAVSFDNKDRWLWSVDAASGERTLLDHLRDEAWVAGPCFAFCVGFLPDSDRVYFVSEATGYAHLYAVDSDGTDHEALTSGEWEVLGARISADRSHFELATNEGSPFNQHAYTMDFDGGRRVATTAGEGRATVTRAPDGKRMAVVRDMANRPPELHLADTDGEDWAQVTTSPTETWNSFPWIKPEIVHFEAEDGTMVPARIYRPADMGAEANGAGVIFVHGAGYLHNVHNYWSSYYREYQFNQFLAAAGYTVLDIDYRGSAGYGAEWRTGIYRWMGGKDLSDQVDGARYLVSSEGVDADRVGLYGGSYGGFITLMGLFTAGDTFKSGAALRSVTDWAHYNHGYTSRILNLPHEDETAYLQSSPIYFAENFGPDQHLVMLHGMVDTNVHFSDVVRLAQRLIELGKPNWEMAVYPVEGHGFVEPSSWTDEYRRIFELFERTLREPDCTQNGGLCDIRLGGE